MTNCFLWVRSPFLLLLLLLLAGCASASPAGELISIPAMAPTGRTAEGIAAPVSDPVFMSESASPAAAASVGVESTDPSNGEDAEVDEALLEIDASLCAEAAAVKADLEAMAAVGADVAELEEAVADLLAELDNCPRIP